MTMKAQMKAALFVCMLVYLMEGGYCTGEHCSCVVNVPPPQLSFNSNGKDGDVAQQMQGPPGKRGPIGARGEKGSPGEFYSDSEELRSIKRTLKVLTGRVQSSEDETEHLQRELNATKEQLRNYVNVVPACSHVVSRQNGTYTIKPHNEVDAFVVDCGFTSQGVITTVHHDSELEISASPECEPILCYKREVTYNATFLQMRALIDLSGDCSQYFKYRCQGSVLGGSSGGWRTFSGELQKYFDGDGPAFTCACGTKGNCGVSTNKCNCDVNGGPEVEDEGFLTNEAHLPVSALHFGDLGDSSEHGWHTLGPLVCKQSL